MKNIIRIGFLVFISMVLSMTISIKPDGFFLSTIFTVSGIMFSIGLGLMVTFNITGVKNKDYVNYIRISLTKIRNSFIFYFSLSVLSYILDKYLRDKCCEITNLTFIGINFQINWPILFFVIMFYSIIYFIVNFINIQKLNNDIFDKVNEL